MSKTKMTVKSAARVQAATAKKGNGGVNKTSFAARAQKAAAKNSKK